MPDFGCLITWKKRKYAPNVREIGHHFVFLLVASSLAKLRGASS